jgi:hypothetical protein
MKGEVGGPDILKPTGKTSIRPEPVLELFGAYPYSYPLGEKSPYRRLTAAIFRMALPTSKSSASAKSKN